MPRPKIPGTDTVQTLTCSWALKAALGLSTEKSGHANPSNLIRAELEGACRRILGDAEWEALVRASRDPGRMERLNGHLTRMDTRRLRTLISTFKSNKAALGAIDATRLAVGIESYWRDLVNERDRSDLPAEVRVVLFEVADVVQKLIRPFQSKPSAKVLKSMLVQIRNLPTVLRSDIEAAILSLPRD